MTQLWIRRSSRAPIYTCDDLPIQRSSLRETPFPGETRDPQDVSAASSPVYLLGIEKEVNPPSRLFIHVDVPRILKRGHIDPPEEPLADRNLKRNKKTTAAAIVAPTEPFFVQVGKQTYSRRQQLAKAVEEGRELTEKQRVAALMSRFGRRTYAGKKKTKPDPVIGAADVQSVIDLGPSTVEPSQLLLSENRELTDWDTAAKKQLGAASVPIRFVGLTADSRPKAGGKSTFASRAENTTACLRTAEDLARTPVVGGSQGAERPYKVRVKLEPVELLEDSVSREEEIVIPDLRIKDVLVGLKTESVDTLEDSG